MSYKKVRISGNKGSKQLWCDLLIAIRSLGYRNVSHSFDGAMHKGHITICTVKVGVVMFKRHLKLKFGDLTCKLVYDSDLRPEVGVSIKALINTAIDQHLLVETHNM